MLQFKLISQPRSLTKKAEKCLWQQDWHKKWSYFRNQGKRITVNHACSADIEVEEIKQKSRHLLISHHWEELRGKDDFLRSVSWEKPAGWEAHVEILTLHSFKQAAVQEHMRRGRCDLHGNKRSKWRRISCCVTCDSSDTTDSILAEGAGHPEICAH